MGIHEYPAERWSAGGIVDSIRENESTLPIPTYDDTEFWRKIRHDDLTAPVVEKITESAEKVLEEPIPRLPATHYLRWNREEEITQPEIRAPLNDRLTHLSALALAECISRDGRYADRILDYTWAICEQSQWSQAPHVLSESRNREGLPTETPPEKRRLVLRTVNVAQTLAHVDYVLGERLHPAARERIRTEVEKRVFGPFEVRNDLWWMSPPTNNWNAAQNGGVIVTALLLLDDVARIGRIVMKGAKNMKYYLESFEEDGCTPEGIGYWNFGFGNYVTAGAYLEEYTNGERSLLSMPIVERIAEYPLRIELSPGRFVPFSDSVETGVVDPATACFLGERFGLENLAARGRREFENRGPVGEIGSALRNLTWCRSVSDAGESGTWPKRQYCDGVEWWIARSRHDDPDSLVVAAKGGHNDEPHNHNDCGSVVVHHEGESLVTDLGKPPGGYTEGYFDDDRYRRYLLVRSLGHSVPVVDETEQAAGEEHAARVVDRTVGTDREQFVLELAGCYPIDSLESLRRTITLQRGSPGQVSIQDAVNFSDQKKHTAASVIVSYSPIQCSGESAIIEGDGGRARLVPDTDTEFNIERISDTIAERDVWRARIEIPVESGTGKLTLGVDVEPQADRHS
jgi:hypothetical protein